MTKRTLLFILLVLFALLFLYISPALASKNHHRNHGNRDSASQEHHEEQSRNAEHHPEERHQPREHSKRTPRIQCSDCIHKIEQIRTAIQQSSRTQSASELLESKCANQGESSLCGLIMRSKDHVQDLLSRDSTPQLICAHLKLCSFSQRPSHNSDDDDDDDENQHHSESKHIGQSDDDDDDDNKQHSKQKAHNDDDDDDDDENQSNVPPEDAECRVCKRNKRHSHSKRHPRGPTVLCVESCDQPRLEEAQYEKKMHDHANITWWFMHFRNKTNDWFSGKEVHQSNDQEIYPLAKSEPASCIEGKWSCPVGLIPETNCVSVNGCRYPRPNHKICQNGQWISACDGVLVPIVVGVTLLLIAAICFIFFKCVHTKRSHPVLVSSNNKRSQKLQDESDTDKLLAV